MIGMFVQSFVMITDATFISSLGTLEYDAVGNAGVLYLAIIMCIQGIADTGQIIIARRIGEKNETDVGRTLRHLVFILISIALLLFICFSLFTESFLSSTVANSSISTLMNDFLEYRKFGILFEAVRIAIVAYFIGIGQTRIIIYATLILAIGNIFLDYTLIFGHFGFPKLGVKGAAIASSTAELLALAFLLIYMLYDKRSKIYRVFEKFKFDKEILLKFYYLSPPLMVQGIIAHGSWYVFFSMIESLGPAKLETSHVIRNLYFIAFIPLYGIGATTKTFVSELIGARQSHLVKPFLKKAIILNFLLLVGLLHGIILYPETIISTINKNPFLISDSQIYTEICTLFILVFGSMLLFGIISPLFNAVSGTGNTKVSMFIEISSIVIYLSCSYLFVYFFKFNLFGVWSVEYIYFGSLGVFSLLYLKFAHWHKKII